jgi:hypothetical protein
MLKSKIRLLSFLFCPAAPIGDIMAMTAFFPKLGLFKSTVQKQTASVTGEIRKLHWLWCTT